MPVPIGTSLFNWRTSRVLVLQELTQYVELLPILILLTYWNHMDKYICAGLPLVLRSCGARLDSVVNDEKLFVVATLA
jgi:hypothetical protein